MVTVLKLGSDGVGGENHDLAIINSAKEHV